MSEILPSGFEVDVHVHPPVSFDVQANARAVLALHEHAGRCPVCGSPRFRVIPGGFECSSCGQARR